MRYQVCKRWNEILSQDSIYHSALFTASFSIPLEISREVFEKTAFTDSRLRNFIFSKAKGLNCIASPRGVVYRDGFLVWWANDAFTFVDFNKTKPASKRQTIKPTNTFLGIPIYALGGGILVYMMKSEEAASKSTGSRFVHFLMPFYTKVIYLRLTLSPTPSSMSVPIRLTVG